MLAAAGTLDLHRPDGSPAKDLKVMELPNNGPEAKRLEAEALASTHRSVYLPLLRDADAARRWRSSTSPSRAWSPAAATRRRWPPRRCTC